MTAGSPASESVADRPADEIGREFPSTHRGHCFLPNRMPAGQVPCRFAPCTPKPAVLFAAAILVELAQYMVPERPRRDQGARRQHCPRLQPFVDGRFQHDCLVIIDEAHVFAPEKAESEAMGPVIDLATRGRKRGYSVVLATQRLPKLAKDAAAECNNKLIGRASQDIDRKRAAEELGFTTREQILSLRDLEPGEFYAFGPAISRDVTKMS